MDKNMVAAEGFYCSNYCKQVFVQVILLSANTY